MNEQDIHHQTILWRIRQKDPIDIRYLNTITYELVSSSWQATRTIRQMAVDNQVRFPLGAEILQTQSHMDDLLFSDHTVAESLEKQSQLIELLKVSMMNLRKWLSYHPKIIEHLAPDTCQLIWKFYYKTQKPLQFFVFIGTPNITIFGFKSK